MRSRKFAETINICYPTMGFFKRNDEQDRAHNARSSDTKARTGRRNRLQRWLDRKGEQAEPDAAYVASSARGNSDIRQERSSGSLADPVNREESPTTQSLWDRAYDALGKEKTQLVTDYEKLLSEEEQMANSASNGGPTIQPHNVAFGPDNQPRQAQLNKVIEEGLRRMEETKARYTIAGHEFILTDQIAQAAKLVLWAKDWVGEAVQASPAASIAWAGVCLIIPLLTNPTTAAEANRDGFINVTARMRYYVALEPLLRRLGQNAGVADALMSEANDHIIDLYQHILEFQICSVLRFYQSRLKTYVKDMLPSKDWKQMTLGIKSREETVNKDLGQINELITRQELEILNKTFINALGAMEGFLSVSTQQLAVLKEQLAIQRDAVRQKLFDKQEECLQLFRLTSGNKDVTYEWYKDRVEDRVQGTCLWFLQHDHFQRWLAQESGPLLVSADPGCGKSVLAKYLIDHELSQQSATICYFFFKDQDQNTARQALCAILHQLFSQKLSLIKHAMESFDKEGQVLVQSEKSLWTILGNAVRDPQAGPVIIVLDALDECTESEFEDLVRNIQSQFRGNQLANAKLKFLLTSRPYEYILFEFQGLSSAFPYIRIPGEQESETISQEINRVVQYRVEQLARKLELSDQIKRCLEERLLEIEHRTYLWVYLVFDYLKTGFKKTPKGVLAAIQTLPENVNQAYERILNKSRESPMVQKVLCVILAASRPLTLSEMNVAVNINEQIRSIHDLDLEEEKTFKSRLRSWCGLFVSIHHGRVYFIHQTAREFLTDSPSPVAFSSELRWHRSITSRHAHTVLAEICVFYLNIFNSDISLPTDHEASGHNNNGVAFLNYSAKNWGIHFHEARIVDNAVIVPLALGICDSDSKSHSTWSNIFCKTKRLSSEYFTGLIVASYFGHSSVVKLLLEKGANVEAKDNDGRTPLEYAARGGHEAVTRMLLEKGADVTAMNHYNRTPLLYAARGGHEAVTRMLLEKGADVNAMNHYNRTPLLYAANRGYEAVTRMLLEKGADVETRDGDGRTPLSYAAEEGHVAVARMLLEKGADVEAKDDDGWTPLMYAANRGYEAVTRMLLEKGADVETRDGDGRTPLSYAAEKGHVAVARMLLEKGADVEGKDNDDRTPLSYAAEEGHVAAARMLLEKGADVTAINCYNRTPLLYAASGGHKAVTRMLLEKGADIEAKDLDGGTPLSSAARGGHEAVARMLLEKGADVEAKDLDGGTPLSSAARGGHEAVARMLLEKGADVEAKDLDGGTPLSLAASRGHVAVTRILLEKGVNVDVRAHDGRTPLLYAATEGHKATTRRLLEKGADVDSDSGTPLLYTDSGGNEAVTRILLEKGADIEAEDDDGWTPLLYAAGGGREAVTRVLLEKGADVEARNHYNQTPLLCAANRGYEAVARMLLEKGADVETRDGDGWTPLSFAASRGRKAVARMLLEKGADVEAKDNDGRTPLSYAAEGGHAAVVKLLLLYGARS